MIHFSTTRPDRMNPHGQPVESRGSVERRQLLVLANRESYRHEYDPDGRIVATRCASGVVNAVEPLLLNYGGVWIGAGSGTAGRVTATDRDGVSVPPENPRYRLRRVWLTKSQYRGYYLGFANGALWPLCHHTHVEPVFRLADFLAYQTVNSCFADVVCEEACDESPIVLVQDYHFALAPRMIRERLPLSAVATFWHIPWPRWQIFEVCPWRGTLLDGLLGSSRIGFQTDLDRMHFIESVEHTLDAHVDRERNVISYLGSQTALNVYPASIEWPGTWASAAPPVSVCRERVRSDLGLDKDVLLGVGVDRLDYTKGLEQKFLAVERLLDRQPHLAGRFVFVQLAEPSRGCLPAYQRTRERLRETAARINQRFASACQVPIILKEDHHPPETVARFFRAADLCYVSSLHDGMNLVSKEFVAARDDEQGVLVLSVFAGAAQELTEALIVNPYGVDQVANALAVALTMSENEQRRRMRRMREVVAQSDARHWAARLLHDAVKPPPSNISETAARWSAAFSQEPYASASDASPAAVT